jgi:hypothetical protein
LVAKKCCSELLFNVEKTQVYYPIHVQEFQIRSVSVQSRINILATYVNLDLGPVFLLM